MLCRCNYIPLICALLTALWNGAPALDFQSGQTAYDNLPDPRLVTLLKTIGDKTGRTGVHPEEGRYLYDLISKNKLTSGLEIGTDSGYSAIWIGMAFGQTGGRLLAVEPSKDQGREALLRLGHAGMLDHVTLLADDPLKVVPMLNGPFDFVFFDGRKQDYLKCFTILLPKIRAGGFLAAHDVTVQSRDLAEFVRKITGDPLLKTEFVPISSAGLSVTLKITGGK